MRAILLLAAILTAAPLQADPRSIPAAADLDAAAATARYAAWRQRLADLLERTEKVTNKPMAREWREALSTGWWPWWATVAMPDLTPRPPVDLRKPWFCIVLKNPDPVPPPPPGVIFPNP